MSAGAVIVVLASADVAAIVALAILLRSNARLRSEAEQLWVRWTVSACNLIDARHRLFEAETIQSEASKPRPVAHAPKRQVRPKRTKKAA